ncbi:MAG: class I SAM-dependent methyltransferase [Anaerolineae bacterium]|nr:class I SAM-dependent methyltransferase [Anaerolineae bacterium]
MTERERMPDAHVDYDRIAPTYDRRYAANTLEGIARALVALVQEFGAARRSAPRVLEVGCGTGRWLAALQAVTPHGYGLDRSTGMLMQARRQSARFHLARGRAGRLPFPGGAFDVVYCVNALHHFDQQRAFISEARRLLRPGGALAVVGMDPRSVHRRWYVYRYFAGTYATDLARFPSWGQVLDWVIAAGFSDAAWRIVERVVDHKIGRAVLDDPFLDKAATSQLALLSDEAYAAGWRRIEAALDEADAAGDTLVFPVDLPMGMLTAWCIGSPSGSRD